VCAGDADLRSDLKRDGRASLGPAMEQCNGNSGICRWCGATIRQRWEAVYRGTGVEGVEGGRAGATVGGGRHDGSVVGVEAGALAVAEGALGPQHQPVGNFPQAKAVAVRCDAGFSSGLEEESASRAWGAVAGEGAEPLQSG
jgi:hypothetical protein